jgi:hypothetical protein
MAVSFEPGRHKTSGFYDDKHKIRYFGKRKPLRAGGLPITLEEIREQAD